jgi:hypothetical protein
MSHLLNKSKQNKDIAKYLQTDSHEICYAASIHCGYYSCFQKVTHIFTHILERDSNEMKKEAKWKRRGSHEHYIKEFRKELEEADRKDAKTLERELLQLKTMRKRADYYDVEITQENARNALEYTEKIHQTIKKYFEL